MGVYAGKDIVQRYWQVRQRNAGRDTRMAQVLAVREGRMSDVAPDLFPDTGPWQEPIIANMIDVAARDLSEMIAPLPAVNCWSPTMTSESAQKRADKRTKIASGMVTASDLQNQMYSAADQYVTYGFLPGRVEIDPDLDMPVIRLLDPVGCYPIFDRFKRVTCMFQRLFMTQDELQTLYPEVHGALKDARKDAPGGGSNLVEVVLYHDKDRDMAFLPSFEGFVLYDIPNPVGECLIRAAVRPGPSEPRGQFDDVLFVQLARSRFALLTMEAAHKAVQAPLVLPPDVPNVSLGPDAIIRTNNPAGVQRLKLDLPPTAFAQQSSLESELRNGARFPEVRTGNMDSSVVTGRGVQALMGGFDTQIKTAQAVMARFLTELIALNLRVEDKVYGKKERILTGLANGTPFEVKYVPAKDIAGDYSVDVQYGLLAGLDPNRWLVFGLQAMGGGLVSKDFMRRQMPADLDAGEEERKIDIENLRESLKAGVLGLAQALPQMAAQGQDPTEVLELITLAIQGRRTGKPIEELVAKALAPKEEKGPQEAGEPQEGQQPQPGGPQGPPEMGQQNVAQLLASLGSDGRANMQTRTMRQQPI